MPFMNAFEYLRVSSDRMRAYSMIALKMLKIQVMIYLSIAFNRVEAAEGAFVLKIVQLYAR